MRLIAYLSSAAALIVLATASVAQPASGYILVAGGVLFVVVVQEIVPTTRLQILRVGLETTALVAYIAALVIVTGALTSPLLVAYGLLALAGALAVMTIAAVRLTRRIRRSSPRLRQRARSIDRANGVAAGAPGGQPPTFAVAPRQAAVASGQSLVAPAETPVAPQPRGPVLPAQHPASRLPASSLLRIGGLGDAVAAPPDALDASVRGLLRRTPEMSAARTLSRGQFAVALVAIALLVAGLVIAPLPTILAVNGVITALYLIALAFNLAIFRALLRKPRMVHVSDADARAIPDEDLPTYTVLVAAYHESEIIDETIRALEALDYPRDRLDILLLLEADDGETIQAAVAARPAGHIRIVVVPDARPKTKPKACNYGLQVSSGELVTIFDAEDRPDPLQLRQAAIALSRLPAQVACLQARLQFRNERQNVLTRWFAAEYVTWFAAVLPALVRLKAPLPLGGTSMHVRRSVLEAVGAWDPFNVTEDADLGIRLRRFGYQTLVLDSVTMEEANSDFINWVKQRSRWYKGYLQTWLVHTRQPRRLWRELGPMGVVGFCIVIGATPLLALLNPLFWLLTALWFLTEPHLVQVLFPPIVFYPALISVVFGNFVALYRTMVAVRLADRPSLVLWVLVVPFYWVFMSIAALRAFVQLFIAPSFWEKTMHGLDRPRDATALGAPH